MYKNKTLYFVSFFHAIFLLGCSGYIIKIPYSDEQLIGKDIATIVIIREKQFQGSLGIMNFGIDAETVAYLRTGEYIELKVPIGLHYVSSGDINSDNTIFYNEVIKIDAVKDGTYCFIYRMDMSLTNLNFFKELTPKSCLDKIKHEGYEKIN